MKHRTPIPRIALPVISALLALSQTVLGQTALGRFIRAKLQAKLMQMLMDGITEFFQDLAKNIATRGENNTAEPAAPPPTESRSSPRRPKRTSDPPPRSHPARHDPPRPAAIPDDRAEASGPDPTQASNPAPPAATPPPDKLRPLPAAGRQAAPQRARSPPDKNGQRKESPVARAICYDIVTNYSAGGKECRTGA
jgi:hypothetical protein